RRGVIDAWRRQELPMGIELVVFEVAGTTVKDDGAVADCLRATVAQRGRGPVSAEINDVMGLPKPEALARLLTSALDRLPHRGEVSQAHDEFERRMVRHYLMDPLVGEIRGTWNVFHALRARGVRVALDTG